MKKITCILIPSVIFAILPPEIPNTHRAFIFFPCNFDASPLFENFVSSVSDIYMEHNYITHTIFDPVPGAPGIDAILPQFINLLNSGYGFICIYTHGVYYQGLGWLAVEFFPPDQRQECEDRMVELRNLYNATSLEINMAPGPQNNWVIMVSSLFLQRVLNNNLPHSLIFIDACESALGNPSIAQAFIDEGAHAVFGFNAVATGLDIQAPIQIFLQNGWK
jgi:hypothetical protein